MIPWMRQFSHSYTVTCPKPLSRFTPAALCSSGVTVKLLFFVRVSAEECTDRSSPSVSGGPWSSRGRGQPLAHTLRSFSHDTRLCLKREQHTGLWSPSGRVLRMRQRRERCTHLAGVELKRNAAQVESYGAQVWNIPMGGIRLIPLNNRVCTF